MKKAATILFLGFTFFNAGSCIAQDSISTKTYFGFGIGTIHDNNYFTLNHFLNPFLSINLKNHVAGIGAIIDVNKLSPSQLPLKYNSPLTGFIAFYRYFPDGRSGRFKLFFEYNFIYDHTHFQYSFVPFSHPSLFDEYTEGKNTTISTTVGSGFTFNISKKIHVYECTGAGISLIKKNNFDSANGTTSSQKTDFTLNIQLGFGYDFNTLLPNKKK
jgi:hypothetical protein